jgi:hypothetical protein
MKKSKLILSIIILALIIIVLFSIASACDLMKQIIGVGVKSWTNNPVWDSFLIMYWIVDPPDKPLDISGEEVQFAKPLPDKWVEIIGDLRLPDKKESATPPVKDSGEEKTAGYTRGEDAIISTISMIGISPDISASQIVQSASTPPQDQIPVVDMPQDTPDIPKQDEGVTVADAEPPPDSPIKQPDDSSPIGGKPGDEPQDAPDTTEEEPSYGEQEQPHHEHDIYTYYQEDIVEGDNIQSITITVNIASGEVYGNHYFEGYIGDGYRTANYEFDTYLDSSDRFSTTSTATIYEDGQNIGEGTLKITGELASDMSFIAGDIIDETVGYGVIYYAYLISQSEEQPSYEDY